MTALHVVSLAAVALTGTVTALVRNPQRQIVVGSVFGLALAILFFAFAAPDVALSQIVVATVAVPVMALLTLARLARGDDDR
jgi:energy-converting hydrogenase B subunit D